MLVQEAVVGCSKAWGTNGPEANVEADVGTRRLRLLSGLMFLGGDDGSSRGSNSAEEGEKRVWTQQRNQHFWRKKSTASR